MCLIKFAVILMTLNLCATGRRLIRSAEEEEGDGFTLNEGTLQNGRSLTPTITTTGLLCLGTMIGPKLVLTFGNCIKTYHHLHKFWVRVPLSRFPDYNYTVIDRLLHPNYNSGSHENDFGILVLKDDVDWKEDQWVGAFLGLLAPLAGDCAGFGFNAEQAIVSTLISVTRGGCNGSVKTSDAMCGTAYDKQDECIITPGSPIIC